jgi:serine/threonine-protein phosphatase Stp1
MTSSDPAFTEVQEPNELICTSTARTDVGMVRQHNEDACMDRPDLGFWVVADGMGGHSAGDVASNMIVERLGELTLEPRLSHAVDEIETVLEDVNSTLRALAVTRDAATIGSTVVGLLIRGAHAVCLWAGDSRAYRVREGLLEQLTQDHALVADLVDRGVLTAAQAENHPQSNLVTRAVGAADALKLDVEIFTISPGDQFILCSDGLDKELTDREIRDTVTSHRPNEVANALVELALARGSRDNVTVVAVTVQGTDAEVTEMGESLDPQQTDSEETVPGFTVGANRVDS